MFKVYKIAIDKGRKLLVVKSVVVNKIKFNQIIFYF